jgi:hypothetical protein
MEIPKDLLEIGKSFEQTYTPVLDFHGWRVAMLRYCDPVDAHHLHRVERHRNTNEVFILTTGEADLILCSGGDTPQDVYVFPMEHHVAYNIADYGWHHVIMSKDAHIVLFERTETSLETSDYATLNPEQLKKAKENLRSLLSY